MTRTAGLLVLLALPAVARAQAPDAAGMWDVAGTTLAQPPVLESGATSSSWNPAAILHARGLRVGVQSVQTPATLGLAGFLFGLSHSVGEHVGVGLLYGRVQVADLLRTTTSPTVEPGEIPVYEQFLGVALGAALGPVRVAGLVRGHDARFDIFRESGLTVDLGARIEPTAGLLLAAGTQFHPADFSAGTAERYAAAAEYTWPGAVPLGSEGVDLAFRYGATLRERRHLEHQLGLGARLSGVLSLDAAVRNERGATGASWRPVVGVSVSAGRYHVFAARGSGLQNLGANYRVGMDVELTR